MICDIIGKFILYTLVIFFGLKLINNMERNSHRFVYVIIMAAIIIMIDVMCENKNINESFSNNYSPAFNNRIGPYSDIRLKPEGGSCWRKPPSNRPLIKPSRMLIPQGHGLPNKDVKSKRLGNNVDAPSVDGTQKSPKSLFMYAFNECRPECCPSTYSCDKGCVCTTEQQRKFINNRGIYNSVNKDYPDI